MKAKITINNIKVSCIIGEKLAERKNKQDIFIDIEMHVDVSKAVNSDDIKDAVDYEKVALEVKRFVGKSRYRLIETLADKIAILIIGKFAVDEIIVRIRKPSALKYADFAQVEIGKKRR